MASAGPHCALDLEDVVQGHSAVACAAVLLAAPAALSAQGLTCNLRLKRVHGWCIRVCCLTSMLCTDVFGV